MRSIRKLVVLGAMAALSMTPAAAQDANVNAFNDAYTAYKGHAQNGEYTEAATQSGRAASIGAAMYGGDSAEAATLTFNHGMMLRLSGQFEEAGDVLNDALSRRQALHGERSANVIPIHMELGRLALDSREAGNIPTVSFDRALNIAEEYYGKTSLELGELNLEVGSQVINAAIDSAAIPYLEDARENLRRINGPNDKSAGRASFHLGQFYMVDERYRRALQYLQEALATYADPQIPASSVEKRTHSWLVRAYEATDDPDEAVKHAEILNEPAVGVDPTEIVPVYRIAPRYPGAALAKGSQGAVVLSFTVDEQGMVQDPKVIERTGHISFEKAALRAVSKFRYAPLKVDGEAVSVEGVTTTMTFLIEY